MEYCGNMPANPEEDLSANIIVVLYYVYGPSMHLGGFGY